MRGIRRLLPGLMLVVSIAFYQSLCYAGLWGQVKKEANSAADALKGAAKRGGHVIQKGAQDTGDAIGHGAHVAGRAIKHAIDGPQNGESSDKKKHAR